MLTNLSRLFVATVPYNPGSIGANSVANDGASVAVPGVRLGDVVLAAIKPTQTANLAPVAARVTADGQVTVAFANTSGGSIDAAAEIWTFVIATPDPGQLPAQAVS